jgi:hypothetical protein
MFFFIFVASFWPFVIFQCLNYLVDARDVETSPNKYNDSAGLIRERAKKVEDQVNWSCYQAAKKMNTTHVSHQLEKNQKRNVEIREVL